MVLMPGMPPEMPMPEMSRPQMPMPEMSRQHMPMPGMPSQAPWHHGPSAPPSSPPSSLWPQSPPPYSTVGQRPDLEDPPAGLQEQEGTMESQQQQEVSMVEQPENIREESQDDQEASRPIETEGVTGSQDGAQPPEASEETVAGRSHEWPAPGDGNQRRHRPRGLRLGARRRPRARRRYTPGARC